MIYMDKFVTPTMKIGLLDLNLCFVSFVVNFQRGMIDLFMKKPMDRSYTIFGIPIFFR